MAIDPKRDQLILIVIDRVEVLQEQTSEQKVAVVHGIKRVRSNRELANLTLVEVGHRFELKDSVTDVEADRA